LTLASKTIYQFAYVRPPSLQGGVKVLDCRVLPNPFVRGVPDDILKVRVRKLAGFEYLVMQGVSALKGADVLYVGCLYGRHRSGAVAEAIAEKVGARVVKL